MHVLKNAKGKIVKRAVELEEVMAFWRLKGEPDGWLIEWVE